MTKEEAISKYVMPAIKRTWNDDLCAEIEQALEQEPSITWVTGADGAKIAFWDVPVWKVTKICEILGAPQESEVRNDTSIYGTQNKRIRETN